MFDTIYGKLSYSSSKIQSFAAKNSQYYTEKFKLLSKTLGHRVL